MRAPKIASGPVGVLQRAGLSRSPLRFGRLSRKVQTMKTNPQTTKSQPIEVTEEMVKRAFCFWHGEEEIPQKSALYETYREMLDEVLNG